MIHSGWRGSQGGVLSHDVLGLKPPGPSATVDRVPTNVSWDSSPCQQTDTTENIIFPQPSDAGGKYITEKDEYGYNDLVKRLGRFAQHGQRATKSTITPSLKLDGQGLGLGGLF